MLRTLLCQSYTESFVVSPDSTTAYVAIPNAPVVGQNPGYIQVVNLDQGVRSQARSISLRPIISG